MPRATTKWSSWPTLTGPKLSQTVEGFTSELVSGSGHKLAASLIKRVLRRRLPTINDSILEWSDEVVNQYRMSSNETCTWEVISNRLGLPVTVAGFKLKIRICRN